MLMAINQIYEVHADGMLIIWLYLYMVIYQRTFVYLGLNMWIQLQMQQNIFNFSCENDNMIYELYYCIILYYFCHCFVCLTPADWLTLLHKGNHNKQCCFVNVSSHIEGVKFLFTKCWKYWLCRLSCVMLLSPLFLAEEPVSVENCKPWVIIIFIIAWATVTGYSS